MSLLASRGLLEPPCRALENPRSLPLYLCSATFFRSGGLWFRSTATSESSDMASVREDKQHP